MESYLGSPALGQESRQMWDLNKRLEAYLSRVKSLEEENDLLRAEIQSLKGSRAERSWRDQYEEEVGALRDALNDRFREKNQLELERDSLFDEIQLVKTRCQREREAQEDAKKELAESKKVLEDERRAQMWLKEKGAQLENELEALFEVHEADKAELEQEMLHISQSMDTSRVAPVAFQSVEIEDYSKRLSEVWQGAVETYKSQVSSLEGALAESKEKLWKVAEENRENQAQMQSLEKELASLKTRKQMLEERLNNEWQRQQGGLDQFQLDVEALEEEKEAMRVQIASVLEDRQQLMNLKLSLSLEVATYRTLLESESMRLLMPLADSKQPSPFRDSRLEFTSSPIQLMSPDVRKYSARDTRLMSSKAQKGDSKALLQKNSHSFPTVKIGTLTKSPRPITVEAPKVNLKFHSQNLANANASGPQMGTSGPKDRNVKLTFPMSKEIKADTKSLSSGLAKSNDHPSIQVESDILECNNGVMESESQQKPKAKSDNMTDQNKSKAFSIEATQKTLTEDYEVSEKQLESENSPLKEAIFIKEVPEEGLEGTEIAFEISGNICAVDTKVTKGESTTLKAMGATFDIPSSVTHTNEPYIPGLPHVDTTLEVEEIKDEPGKLTENSVEADTGALRDVSSDQLLHLEDQAGVKYTEETKVIKSTHHENNKEAIYEENQFSGILSTVEKFDIGVNEEMQYIEDSKCEKEELQLLSMECRAGSAMTVKPAEHLLETDLQMCSEAEWNDNDKNVYGSERGIPQDTVSILEESDIIGPDSEVKETSGLQMTEDENTRELASAAEDTEDYDVVSDVQESMFFKTEPLSTGDAELTEVTLNKTKEQVAGRLIFEHGEKEEDMLTDTEDLTEELDNDDRVEMVTEYEILSVRINETSGVNEKASEIENPNLIEDATEEEINTDQENDTWKNETLDAAVKIVQEENLYFENETRHINEKSFELDDLSHEDLDEKVNAFIQESVCIGQEEQLMCQGEPLPTESELANTTESETEHSKTEALSEPLPQSQGPTCSDDFITSTDKKYSNSEWVDTLDSECCDLITKSEPEEYQTEPIKLGQYMQLGRDIVQNVASYELLDTNEAQQGDTNNAPPTSKETCEDEIEVLTEPLVEDSSELPKGVEVQEPSDEQAGLESYTRGPEINQKQIEYAESGDAIDEQNKFSHEMSESDSCDVNNEELEFSKDYLLEETLPDTTPLPSYDDEAEIVALQTQESEEVCTQVKQEIELLKAEQLTEHCEIGQDITFEKEPTQKVVTDKYEGANEEEHDDSNNVVPTLEEALEHDAIVDDAVIYPKPYSEKHNAELQESDEEQEVSETYIEEPDIYNEHTKDSVSKDSGSTLPTSLQNFTQSEICNADMQTFEKNKEYVVENSLADNTTLPSHDDETEIPEFLDELTVTKTEGDVLLCDENSIKLQLPSEVEVSACGKVPLPEIDTDFNQATTETVKGDDTVAIHFLSGTESGEEKIPTISTQQDFNADENRFTDESEERDISANVQNSKELFDQDESIGRDTQEHETQMPTKTDTRPRQEEGQFAEVEDESPGDMEEYIDESDTLKAIEMTDEYQDKFECDKSHTQGLESENSAIYEQNEWRSEDVAVESSVNAEDDTEEIECHKTNEMHHLYQEKCEGDETMTHELEPSPRAKQDEGYFENAIVESHEDDRDVTEESEAFIESEMSEINQGTLEYNPIEAHILESEMPINTVAPSIKGDGEFEEVEIESLQQAKGLTGECETVQPSQVKDLHQEKLEYDETEVEELESEMATNTDKISEQEDGHFDNVESPDFTEKVVEESDALKAHSMIKIVQEAFENDDTENHGLLAEMPIDTVTPSKCNEGHVEDVVVESPELIDEIEVLKASEIIDVDLGNDDLAFGLKSEPKVTSSELDLLPVIENIPESAFELNSARIVDTVDPQTDSIFINEYTTTSKESQPENGIHNQITVTNDSEDITSSDEESPNATEMDDSFEHSLIRGHGTNPESVISEAGENIEVHAPTGSQEQECEKEEGENAISSQKEMLSNSADLSNNEAFLKPTVDWFTDLHQESTEEKLGSADALVDETIEGENERHFVIKPENFVLNALQFTEKSHFLEENVDEHNGVYEEPKINDLSEIAKEMLNGHSNIDEMEQVEFIHQKSPEKIESDTKGEYDSDSSEGVTLNKQNIFPFTKSDKSQSLFQTLLGTSNEKESTIVKQDHMFSSEEEASHEEDQNGNGNTLSSSYAKGTNIDDQFQTIADAESFEQGQHHIGTDQQQKETVGNVSGVLGVHSNDDAWSSGDE
ncbi:tanabin-like [Ambystoma mexicanum]|uniref:tanabin-like n=1 Tax=Ambystoma mexicanum TaxID=8296 RepID=UPI0037E73D9C